MMIYAWAWCSNMDKILARYDRDLLEVKRRHFVLTAFQEELERVSMSKKFWIWNDVAWLAVLDMRDVLVIHVSSWTEGVFQKGGLFGQIRAGHLNAFPAKRNWADDREAADGELRRIHDENHANAYRRLFPASTGARPNGPDVDALRERFIKMTQRVRDDRNRNRAHPYERMKQAKADMLDFQELGALFDEVERMLNDLRLLSIHSMMEYTEVNATDSDSVARDLVDMVLCGTSVQIEMAGGERRRDEFYEEMHAAHEAEPTPDLFNDKRFLFTRV